VSKEKPRAVVLLSGGLDSATCLAIAGEQGFQPYALTVRYGQRHEAEIAAATHLAKAGRVHGRSVGHDIIDIDLAQFGGSALTGDADVPKGRSDVDIQTGIPVTYVPARNTIFLSLALARAETLNARDIFIGVNAMDYSGYPDCHPAFIEAFERLANLATKVGVEAPERGEAGITIHAPLIGMTKSAIVERGHQLDVDFARTVSCYDPVSEAGDNDVLHCGRCDACSLRKKGFKEAGLPDPTPYSK